MGIEVMTTRELFDFVTRYTLQEEEYESYIEKVEVVSLNHVVYCSFDRGDEGGNIRERGAGVHVCLHSSKLV